MATPKSEIDFLSFEEAEQSDSHAEPGRWKPRLTLTTGLGIGELAALSWACVDMANGRLVVKRNVTIEMAMRHAHLSPGVNKDAVRTLDVRPNGTLTAHRQEARPRN